MGTIVDFELLYLDAQKRIRELEAELATLLQQQGEPVAYLRDDGDGGLEFSAPGNGFAVYREAAPRVPGECEWRCDDDVYMPDTWDGTCGVKWSFIDGGPVENNVLYCPECGKPVRIAAAPEPNAQVTSGP